MSFRDDINFDLLGGFLKFGLGVIVWLALVYVFNYALVALDNSLFSLLPTEFLPAYRIFNMCWSAVVAVGIVKFYILARKGGGAYG